MPTANEPDQQPPAPAKPPLQPVNIHGANVIAHLKILEANWPSQCEVFNYQARCIRQKYLSAMEEGFTDAQAMHLSTQPWN